MKERPILFSGPMVRAILAGRKTQTRRTVKQQPSSDTHSWWCTISSSDKENVGLWTPRSARSHDVENDRIPTGDRVKCPYGSDGDRLWVKETWLPFDNEHVVGGQRVAYRADGDAESEELRKEYIRIGKDYRWRPSIYMPRKASRITLEIESIRVERLNDISEEDALAEGVVGYRGDREHGCKCGQCALDDFAELWESLNGDGSWSANPWVWVVTFHRLAAATEKTEKPA